jgi:hypothetical protein
MRVMPYMLDRHARYNETVEISSNIRDTLVAAIDGTKLYQTKYGPDIRWGAVFLDRSERKIHSIYLNRRYINGTGSIGLIDGAEVGLNGSLVTWFELNFLNH